MKPITESHIEQSAIETLQAQGWAYLNGKDGGQGNFTTFAIEPMRVTKQR
ncbi:MAG: hypothetical protein H6577_00475 [Lewinellaceae bacterium]|nr:hypothetical protein [Lewinellaceae bacterium]